MQARLITEGLSEYALLLIEAVACNTTDSRIRLELALKPLAKDNGTTITQEMLTTIEELLTLKTWKELWKQLAPNEEVDLSGAGASRTAESAGKRT